MVNSDPLRVGDLRPSQFMWAFGPGALVDLPQISVIVLGPEHWRRDWSMPINEARLLRAVRRKLGRQVEQLMAPPIRPDSDGPFNPHSPEAKIGAPVAIFPEFLRCPVCQILAPSGSGLFELRGHLYRPDRVKYVHSNCNRANQPTAVAARFLLACRMGHLDDFPWHWYVHGGRSSCQGMLRFYEEGASLQTENLWVRCSGCNAARSMAQAFGDSSRDFLPGCRGRHPHLGDFDQEPCREETRTVLLGASNSWFPITASVLAIPTQADALSQIVEDRADILAAANDKNALTLILKTLRLTGQLGALSDYSAEEIWDSLQKINATASAEEQTESDLPDLKIPEWEAFSNPHPVSDWPDFMVKVEDPPLSYREDIERVLLLERLREVNALLGFTRIEPLEIGHRPEEGSQQAPLWRGRPTWVPATEVRGEGIFIKFSSQKLMAWLNTRQITARRETLLAGHRGWRSARRLLPPDAQYPGMLMTLLHSFSHILLRELSLECGYNAASIRERIYASSDGENPDMAGILLYTAAADSDGTLGGLVELGKKENLERLISQALMRVKICSSDPLCAEHTPETDRTLHGAACHACLFAPETSCEFGNRYLDRALLIPTLHAADLAFFQKEMYAAKH